MRTKKRFQNSVALSDNSEVCRSIRVHVQRVDSAFAAEPLIPPKAALSLSRSVIAASYPFGSRILKDQRTASASLVLAHDVVVPTSENLTPKSNRTHPSTANAIVETERSADSRVRNGKVEVAGIEAPAKTPPILVAVVDDDRPFREALVFQLATAGFQAVAYPSAEDLLAAIGSWEFDCVVADIRLPRLNGLQLFAEMKKSVPFASIVFVTGRGEFSIGIQAMRQGAIDCLEKPIDDEVLINSIRRASEQYRRKRAEDQQRVELQKRAGRLTPREHEVFGLVASGLLNKQVGATLGATERTVKTHRGRVMGKMRADSLADLVRMAEILRIYPVYGTA